jgi:cyclic-di-GMP phosphodiesterase TipF (flagellum assembly factor)
MSTLSHIVIVISYAFVAAAVAFALPETVAGVDRATGFMAGATVFVGSAVLHEVFARRMDTDELSEELHEVRASYADVLDELKAVHRKLVRIEANDGRTDDDILAEMRVLRSLLGKLAERPGDAKPKVGFAKRAAANTDTAGETAYPPPQDLSGGEILGITRDALEENRVDLYLQPIVSLPQRKVRFYEAFSRIRSDDGAIIVPQQYLPVATESGLISTIDNILLFRCIQHIRRRRTMDADVGFFCNISPHTLADSEFFDQFVDFMRLNVKLAKSLIFEFGQAEVDAYGAEAWAQLERLSNLGFRFSMDRVTNLDLDFLELRRRRFSFVKVEARNLVSEYEKVGASIDVTDLAEAMKRNDINLIAEKVESERVVPELLDFDVDFGQGYLFGEPTPAQDEAA